MEQGSDGADRKTGLCPSRMLSVAGAWLGWQAGASPWEEYIGWDASLLPSFVREKLEKSAGGDTPP